MRLLRDLGFQSAGDILFESVVDEELASGNGTLAARMRGHNADIVLVPEPTQMEICPACLGGLVGELTIIGKSGIPFTGHAIPNPITGAARAVELFGQWERKWRSENSHPLFKGPGKELKIMIWKIDSTLPEQFTQMGMPLQVNLSWAVWCYPGTTEDEILQRLMAYWQKHAESDPALRPFKVALEKTFHFVRPWETSPKHPAVKALVRAFRDVGGDPVISGAPISCDLGIYGEFGKMPAVLLGPRCDNLHATDEWVEIRDIISLTEIFDNLPSDIGSAEFLEINERVLLERLGPEKYNLLFKSGGFTLDLDEIDTTGLQLQIPRSSWIDGIIDDTY